MFMFIPQVRFFFQIIILLSLSSLPVPPQEVSALRDFVLDKPAWSPAVSSLSCSFCLPLYGLV